MTDRNRILDTMDDEELAAYRANGGKHSRPGPVTDGHRKASELAGRAWSLLDDDVNPRARRDALRLLREAVKVLKELER